ncbi:MAG: 50S ribosomal protein L31e [Nanoarchaeota archaeon]
MAEERIYTIPLRKEFSKAPSYKKTKRALTAIKAFLIRHMNAEDVKIGKYLNLELWKHGRQNPPPRIKIKAIKDIIKIKDKDVIVVRAELINAPVEVVKEEKTKKKEGKVQVEEKKLEDKIERLEEEKKEVLEHEKVEHKERKTKSFVEKTKPTQKEKRSGIIGSTGKK